MTRDASSYRRARHVLVLDDDVSELGPALSAASFLVVHASPRELGADERADVLGQRILVTRSTRREYLEQVLLHECGIIGLDALTHVDPSQDYATNPTAQLVSEAFVDYDLARQTRFLLMFHPNRRHAFRRLG